jgi:hypothetical protein
MTEAEWLNAADAGPMLEFLEDRASDRKLRLFAAACCRRIWDRITDGRSRAAVETCESGIEQAPAERALAGVWKAAEAASCEAYDPVYDLEHAPAALREEAALAAARRRFHALDAPFCLLQWTDGEWARPDWGVPPGEAHRRAAAAREVARVAAGAVESSAAEARAQADLLRDLFGNPWRPASLDSAWLTRTATALARAAYEGRRFEGLPILGDALEEAGCDREEILAHCRGPGPHVRGCWVVDALLGKG